MNYLFSFTKPTQHVRYKVVRRWIFLFRLERIVETTNTRHAFTLSKESGEFVLANQAALGRLLKDMAPGASMVQLEENYAEPKFTASAYVSTQPIELDIEFGGRTTKVCKKFNGEK